MRKSAGAAEAGKTNADGAGDQSRTGVDATQEPDTTNSMDLEAARLVYREEVAIFCKLAQ